MQTDIINDQDILIPDKHPQRDLFICDVADAVLKDIMPHMEHPFYSLSKKPEMKVRRYEHNGNWLEVIPSFKGLATIYDKDILIYAISQIMAKYKDEVPTSKKVRLSTRNLLIFTNRGTAGKDYIAIADALLRLGGTQIRTNIVTGDEEQLDTFGLIDKSSIRRKNGLDGRLLWVELELSDWVFNAIKSKHVLTLHRDYFRLRKPIERRIYELARKHCGHKKQWVIGLEKLHKKTGSQSELKKFRFAVKNIVKTDHLPDYTIEIDEAKDQVIFRNREKWWDNKDKTKGMLPPISPAALEEAKKKAPAYDVYYLEQMFREWFHNSGREQPKNTNGAFIGFCKKVQSREITI